MTSDFDCLSTAKANIISSFENIVQRDKKMNTGILLVHSEKLGIHCKTAKHHDSSVEVNPDQPYHFASIGKTITSILIAILYEKGKIDFDDFISKYLDRSIINRLHVWKEKDYSEEIKIRHLLNHTSGLADYYMDRNSQKIRLIDLMISQPDKFWEPLETIEWSKKELRPKFQPGSGFHYSDTNYQLLGLIIEKLTGLTLHQAFHNYIFQPLEMDHSYQIFYSHPEKNELPMVDLYYRGLNLSHAKSISMSWASGGIVSTSEDMLKFIKAVVKNKLISDQTFQKMKDFAKMSFGLTYGYGIMNFRFMMMPRKYDIWGNSGSIGAFMYYNPSMDLYFIGSFNKLNCQTQPIFFIINAMRKINKCIKNRKKAFTATLPV